MNSFGSSKSGFCRRRECLNWGAGVWVGAQVDPLGPKVGNGVVILWPDTVAQGST